MTDEGFKYTTFKIGMRWEQQRIGLNLLTQKILNIANYLFQKWYQ